MNENLKNLLEKINSDEDLRARFDSICQMDDKSAVGEAMLAFAAEVDMPLEAADLETQGELDPEELDAVSGAGYPPHWEGVSKMQREIAEMRRAEAAKIPPGMVLRHGKLMQKPD